MSQFEDAWPHFETFERVSTQALQDRLSRLRQDYPGAGGVRRAHTRQQARAVAAEIGRRGQHIVQLQYAIKKRGQRAAADRSPS
jgi:hypothetical protein